MNWTEELKIFSGNAHPVLAKAVCSYLEMEVGKAEVFEFSNENIFVKILENIRHRDVFIMQPLCRPVNKSIMELLIMIDAARRASAGRVTAVIPFYAYGRTDKKDQPRVPITARLLADLITTAGADRVLTIDLHAGQIQGFFNIPVDELTALPILANYFNAKANGRPKVVVSTDEGGVKKARDLADRLNARLAIVEKKRIGNEERVEASHLIGDVNGAIAILVDDEIDTGGSMAAAINVVKEHGAVEVYAAATHAVLSRDAISKIKATGVRELVVTDTIPVTAVTEEGFKLVPLSVAPLLGEAISRIHSGRSVGALFN